MSSKKITDVPKTVKEAIDWLIRIGRKDDTYNDNRDNSDAFCSSVNAQLGNGENIEKDKFNKLFEALGTFIGWTKKENGGSNGKTGEIKSNSQGIGKSNENGSGYQSAYGSKSIHTLWVPCLMRKEASQGKSCCTPPCANCGTDPYKECPPEGCCQNCPKRICARIFCTIVPILYSVMNFLKSRVQQPNGKQGVWGTQCINGSNGGRTLSRFMKACGFEPTQLSDKKGSELAYDSLGGSLDQVVMKLQDVKEALENPIKNGTSSGKFSSALASESSSISKPNTICDMLSWLFWLPFCSDYKQVLTEAQSLINNGGKNQNEQLSDGVYINNLIAQIPLVFTAIEGSAYTGNSLFHYLGPLSQGKHVFDYQDATETAKMLFGIILVLADVFHYLMKQCQTAIKDKNNKPIPDTEGPWNGDMLKDSGSLFNYCTFMGFNVETSADSCGSFKGQYLYGFFGGNSSDSGLMTFLMELNGYAMKYFKIIFDSPTTQQGTKSAPTTVRQMMLWLVGFGLTGKHTALTSGVNGQTALLDQNKIRTLVSNSQMQGLDIASQLSEMSTSLMATIICIEGGIDSLNNLFTNQPKVKDDCLLYEEAPMALFSQLVEYSHIVMTQLRFLFEQCSYDKSRGGWGDCNYGGAGVNSGDGVHCSCDVKSTGSSQCPRPLQRFLTGDPNNRIGGLVTYRGKAICMGFHEGSLDFKSSSGIGRHICATMELLFDTPKKPGTLSSLCAVLTCLFPLPPRTLGDIMAFYQHLGDALLYDSQSAQQKSIKAEIEHEANKEPTGPQSGILTYAVEVLGGRSRDQRHTHTTYTDSSIFDLRSLMGCTPHYICAPLLQPIMWKSYSTFDVTRARQYVSCIVWLTPRLYQGLQSMRDAIKESSCIRGDSTQSNCEGILRCPEVLPLLYRNGLIFGDRTEFEDNESNKCTNLLAKIEGLITCDADGKSKLHVLLHAVDAFLWSIRLPFSLVQLSLWSVAILFISYVFVVPLDHFKIKSHLFNRLKYTMHPSLLIADGQRRVSEVAYFSL